MLTYLNPLRWNRKVLILCLVVFVVLWFGFIDTYSIMTRLQLSGDINRMQQDIERMDKASQELQSKLEAFEADPNLLEKIARETYYMRKEGETVYRIQPVD
jgi:cell division protein FtsB